MPPINPRYYSRRPPPRTTPPYHVLHPRPPSQPLRRHSISTTPMSSSLPHPYPPFPAKRVSDTSHCSSDDRPAPHLVPPHSSSPTRRPSADLSLSPLSSEYDPGSPPPSSAASTELLPTSRSLYGTLRPDPAPAPSPYLAKSASARALGMPTGKVEFLPLERPPTPCRLPRPKVFITPSAVRLAQIHHRASHLHLDSASDDDAVTVVDESHLFFTDDDDDISDDSDHPDLHHPLRNHSAKEKKDTPADFLQHKVHRVLSNLRSISFQSPVGEDLDTAWGQATGASTAAKRRNDPVVNNRWRRPRGRISSRNGVQEFAANDCYSEADAVSEHLYANQRRARASAGREARRGFGGRMLPKKSLWSAARRERCSTPASPFLMPDGPHGYLAASTLNEPLHTVTAVVSAERESGEKRASVDKYVEFIHASAQRESRSGLLAKNLPRRMMSRAQAVFRRKWK